MLTGHLTVFNVSYVLILITKAEVILLVSSNVVCIASRVQTRETFSHAVWDTSRHLLMTRSHRVWDTSRQLLTVFFTIWDTSRHFLTAVWDTSRQLLMTRSHRVWDTSRQLLTAFVTIWDTSSHLLITRSTIIVGHV